MLTGGGTKDLIEGVSGVIDDLHTSEEEKLAASQKIKELVSNYEVQMEKEISTRWTADMASDSWMSKNVRPLVLVFLVISTVLMIFIEGSVFRYIFSSFARLVIFYGGLPSRPSLQSTS